jgi:hypothetical protein
MTKGIYSIILLFCISVTLKAQTVEETKSWILTKMNKYQQDFFSGKLKGNCDFNLMFHNFSSKFQQDTFVVAFELKMIFPDCFVGDRIKKQKEAAKKAIVKIPITDISRISTLDEKRFQIHTNLSTMRMVTTFDSGDIESFTDLCSIGFNFNTEESLFERLQNAFIHLQSFYPKKAKKESF